MVAIVSTATLALGGSLMTSATTTSTDVTALAKAEGHYTSILRAYANTPAWLAKYRAALTVATADQAKVTADLGGKAAGPSGGPAFVFSGQSGAIKATTRPFGLHASLPNWSLSNCMSGAPSDDFSAVIAAGAYGTKPRCRSHP